MAGQILHLNDQWTLELAENAVIRCNENLFNTSLLFALRFQVAQVVCVRGSVEGAGHQWGRGHRAHHAGMSANSRDIPYSAVQKPMPN